MMNLVDPATVLLREATVGVLKTEAHESWAETSIDMRVDNRAGISPAVVAFAPVGAEGVVQGPTAAALVAGLHLAGFAVPIVAEVVGVGKQPQEAHEAVQLAHSVLHSRQLASDMADLVEQREADGCTIDRYNA